MRNAEKTVGNMIDKEKTIFVGSVDAEGFPNIKAMLQTRKREGLKHIYLSTNTSSMRVSQFLKNNRACLYVCNINPEKPDMPLNKNDAFQKLQKRRVQEKR